MLIGFLGYLPFSPSVQAQEKWSFGPLNESGFTVERVLTTEEGLPANGVNNIIQDSKGYIWAATYNGLVRYDGRKIKVFNSANVPQLYSNRFLDVMEDSKGRIWAGLEYNNLMVIDDSVTVYNISSTDDNQNIHITVISETPDGRIMVGTNNSLLIFEDGSFRKLDGLKTESVQQIIHKNNFSYILLQTILYRLFPDGSKDKILLQINEQGEIEHPNYNISEFAKPGFTFIDMSFRDNELWLLSHGGLAKIKKTDYEIILTSEDLKQDLLHGFYFNDNTLFVFGTGGLFAARGIYTRDLKIEKFSGYTSNDLLIDHEGSVWLATGAFGLRQFVSTPVLQVDKYEQLAGKAITGILQSNEKGNPLYIGTNCDGLYKYSANNVERFSAESGIENNCVWSLMKDSDGILWVGTWGRGAYYRSPGSDSFQRFNPTEMEDANAVLSIYEDNSGRVWFGTYYNGLFRKDGDMVETITMADGSMLPSIRSFYEDDSNRLWVATDRGLGYVKDDYFVQPKELNAIKNQNIRTIQQDGTGRFWVGSYGGGLFTFERGGELINITQEQGLFDNTISQLAFDTSGNIWLGGNLGVFFIERTQINSFLAGKIAELKISRLGVKEGLPIRETTGGFMPSSFMDDNGVFYIPTVQGISVIHTNRMILNRARPNVIIEEVEVNGTILKPKQISSLSYKSQRLVFKFAALTFSNSDNAHFQYKLEGFDSDWHEGDELPEVVYTSLPAGSYTLYIRASNNDGFWYEEGTALEFTIQPPFWQTFWFYFLAVFTLSGCIIGFLNYRTRLYQLREKKLTALVEDQTATIREEKELLEKAYFDLEKNKSLIEESKHTIEEQTVLLRKNDEIRSRFFSNISHELRAPLTLIKGMLEQSLKGRFGSGTANKKLGLDLNAMATHANRLQSQVDYLLELSSLEVGDIQVSRKIYDLNSQVSLLADLFETVSQDNKVRFTFEMEERPILIQADPEKIEKVLLSLFSKSMYYTNSGGWIKINTYSISKAGKSWAKFIIKSSAVNITEEEKVLLFDHFYYQTKTPGIPIHASLALVKEWLELHKGSISLETIDGNNLCMQILLPQLVLESTSKTNLMVEIPQEISNMGVGQKDNASKTNKVLDEDKKNIVLVEDNMAIRLYLRELLKGDYNVMEAGDGVEAFELIKDKSFHTDLVISDLSMPELNGNELCRMLRKNIDTSTVPFMLLTAKADEKNYIEGIKSGIDAYITKPFKENVLKETILNLIENRDRLTRHFKDKQSLDDLILKNGQDSLLVKLNKCITENMENPELSVEILANRLHMSQRQLQRKIKEETGLTPKKYLRKRRLEAARHLIEQDYGSITEVAYAVGFNTLSLFSAYFKEEFGKLPSDWNKEA
ncbi:MAG: two-component regulator propeller domain-containing protein [Balneolaceae bacterium]